MEKIKKGVNYKATEDFLDQLRSFIIERYVEIYNYNPLKDLRIEQKWEHKSSEIEYNELLYMLQTCYEIDNGL